MLDNLFPLFIVSHRIRPLPFFTFVFITFVIVFVWHRQFTEKTYNYVPNAPPSFSIPSLCNCEKDILTVGELPDIQEFDWCSPESSFRGKHQKVITYSLYGNANNASIFSRYYSLLKNISQTAEKAYPGWIIRIYHNITEYDEASNLLCDVYCRFQNVDLCSVPQLVDRIGDNSTTSPINITLIQNLNPRMFRFLVMFDSNVDVFISRDVDSVIWPREVDAVNEWLRSNYTFHVMRDHKAHFSIMLAGMWGAKMDQNRNISKSLIKALVISGQNQIKWQDQMSLEDVVWPIAKFDVMAHDSYQCENKVIVRKSQLKVFPFPSKRNGKYYVGGAGHELDPVKCPEACRPPEHKDWEFC